MSRNQWTIGLSGNIAASFPSPGLSGPEAVRVACGNEGTANADLTVTPASGLPHGRTQGRLRCLFRVTGDMSAAWPNNVLGLFFQSQEAAVIGTPNVTCYGVVVAYNQVTLRKVTGSQSLAGGDILATAPQGYVPGTLLSLQAQWEIVNANQVRMQVWRGTTPTYSNLSTILDHTDLSGAYLTSQWEGACVRQVAASPGGLLVATLDRLELYHKTP
jgi:hypothetical protein